MGTTFESIHILNGDPKVVRQILPQTVAGVWSKRFVSVFAKDHEKTGSALARKISRKVDLVVLAAGIYDSNVVEFALYQDGKRVFHHMSSPEKGRTVPNAQKFCELLGLEPEDANRLGKIWSVADAEDQLELTAAVLGIPSGCCPEELPEQIACRDIEKVDHWLKGIATPPKIRNTSRAELIQELKHFRMTVNGRDMVRSPLYYMSDEPWFAEGIHQKTVWWKIEADGTLTPAGETKQRLYYQEAQGRLIGVSFKKGIVYDSMGALPWDHTNGGVLHILDHGRILVPRGNRMDQLLNCCDAEGNCLWTHDQDANYLGCGDEKILLHINEEREGKPAGIVKSVDAQTGRTLGRIQLDTHTVYFHGYRDGAWWISYYGDRDGQPQNWLLKLDEKAQVLGEIPIENEHLLDMTFSPEGQLMYLYFYRKKVQVIHTDTLTTVGELLDRTLRIPCGTDRQGRVWMRCAASTMEAWDRELKILLARHKLKGTVEGVHLDEDRNLCAAAWDKKKAVMRVYRMIEK